MKDFPSAFKFLFSLFFLSTLTACIFWANVKARRNLLLYLFMHFSILTSLYSGCGTKKIRVSLQVKKEKRVSTPFAIPPRLDWQERRKALGLERETCQEPVRHRATVDLSSVYQTRKLQIKRLREKTIQTQHFSPLDKLPSFLFLTNTTIYKEYSFKMIFWSE